jgi:hypothetical protein
MMTFAYVFRFLFYIFYLFLSLVACLASMSVYFSYFYPFNVSLSIFFLLFSNSPSLHASLQILIRNGRKPCAKDSVFVRETPNFYCLDGDEDNKLIVVAVKPLN